MNEIPFNVDSIIATLASLYRHQQKTMLVKIIEGARASIEETEYDNWNGGTYYYTLYLDISIELFASIESNLSKYEKEIESKLQVVLRGMGSQVLNNVVIRPLPIDQPSAELSRLITDENLTRIWGDANLLKVFIGHQHENKTEAVNLKKQLSKYKIEAFVAHEDIEPTLPWQREIKLALSTMDVFLALLTSHFRESKWTDHEVGFAVAKGVLIIHVRDGLDPYGFISETQSLSVPIESSENMAIEVVKILQKSPSTKVKMREALFIALEDSYGHSIACKIMKRIESLEGGVTKEEIQRIREASNKNEWVKDAYTVKEFLEKIDKLSMEEEIPF